MKPVSYLFHVHIYRLAGKNPDDYATITEEDKDDKPFNYDKSAAMDYYTEDQFNSYLSQFKVNCRINNDVKGCGHDPKEENWVYDSRPFFANICFPLAPKVVKSGKVFGQFNNGILGDLKTAKWMIVGSVGIAILIW